MTRSSRSYGALAAAVLLLVTTARTAFAADITATANLSDLAGKSVGAVTLLDTPNGVLLKADLHDLPPGVHGMNIHEVGACAPPFASAGGHFNPDQTDHGILSRDGPHAGDLPNLHVPDNGRLFVEVFDRLVTLAPDSIGSLVEGKRTAIVITEAADAYRPDPDGRTGRRIACGVIK